MLLEQFRRDHPRLEVGRAPRQPVAARPRLSASASGPRSGIWSTGCAEVPDVVIAADDDPRLVAGCLLGWAAFQPSARRGPPTGASPRTGNIYRACTRRPSGYFKARDAIRLHERGRRRLRIGRQALASHAMPLDTPVPPGRSDRRRPARGPRGAPPDHQTRSNLGSAGGLAVRGARPRTITVPGGEHNRRRECTHPFPRKETTE